MPTTTVTVKTSKSDGLLLVVRIDGTKLQLDDSGKGTRDVKSDAVHALDYFVRGQPGGTFTVAVTAPVEARFSRSGTLDDDQLALGHEYFSVDA